MQENIKQSTSEKELRRFAAVPVPEHLQQEVRTFVEQLMKAEGGVGAYNRFLETILGGEDSGSIEVTSSPEIGTTGGYVLEILYD